ncbi:MAG: hypothetical protein EXR79_01790 [Myxococcales bacterium]|nr:hypothetical protein [Myxococcales bacterium]
MEHTSRHAGALARGGACGVLVVALWGATGCSVDGLLLTALTRKGHAEVPLPAPLTLVGVAAPHAAVLVLGSDGLALAGLHATATASGRFAVEIEGARSLRNAVVHASAGWQQALAVVPEWRPQASVFDPPRTVELVSLSPAAATVGPTTTALALLVVARARSSGQALAAIGPSTVEQTLIDLHARLAKADAALVPFALMVARIDAAGRATQAKGPVVLPYDLAGPALLRVAHLVAHPLDYSGDGTADTDTAAFDGALAKAAASFQFNACFVPDRIRVVLQTRVVAAAKNGNCETFDSFLWAQSRPDSKMFVTGGIHKDAPACDSGASAPCLGAAQIDAANAALGRWVPNQVPMYDDGSHGDATAGDGIWTVALDLPWLDPALAAAPVRIAYKFTFGASGQGWTGSEEFPGNQRLLELVDVDGDHVVTRFDLFADETSNKDKANGLAPAAGGCGEVKWRAAAKADCASDVRERPVDLDGDCKPDGFAPPGPAGPLTLPCAKPGAGGT